MLDMKTGENYRAAAERLQTERDESRARVAELEAENLVLQAENERLRSHRCLVGMEDPDAEFSPTVHKEEP